jgi:hypothetical protein
LKADVNAWAFANLNQRVVVSVHVGRIPLSFQSLQVGHILFGVECRQILIPMSVRDIQLGLRKAACSCEIFARILQEVIDLGIQCLVAGIVTEVEEPVIDQLYCSCVVVAEKLTDAQ